MRNTNAVSVPICHISSVKSREKNERSDDLTFRLFICRKKRFLANGCDTFRRSLKKGQEEMAPRVSSYSRCRKTRASTAGSRLFFAVIHSACGNSRRDRRWISREIVFSGRLLARVVREKHAFLLRRRRLLTLAMCENTFGGAWLGVNTRASRRMIYFRKRELRQIFWCDCVRVWTPWSLVSLHGLRTCYPGRFGPSNNSDNRRFTGIHFSFSRFFQASWLYFRDNGRADESRDNDEVSIGFPGWLERVERRIR